MAHDNQPIVISARDINQLPPESLPSGFRALRENDLYAAADPVETAEGTILDTAQNRDVETIANTVRDFETGEGSLILGSLRYVNDSAEKSSDEKAREFGIWLKENLGADWQEADDNFSKSLKLMQREFPDHPLLVLISYFQDMRLSLGRLVADSVACLTQHSYMPHDIPGKTPTTATVKNITSSTGETYQLVTITCHNFGFKNADRKVAFSGTNVVKVMPGELTCRFILTPFGYKAIDFHSSHSLIQQLTFYTEDQPADSKQALLAQLMEALQPEELFAADKLPPAQARVEVEPAVASAADQGKGKQKEAAEPAAALAVADKGKGKQKEEVDLLEAALSSDERRLLKVIGRLEQALIQNKNYQFATEYAYRRFLVLLRHHHKEFTNNSDAVNILIEKLSSLTQFIEDPKNSIRDLTVEGLPEAASSIGLSFNVLKQAILLAQSSEQMHNAAALLHTIQLTDSHNPENIASIAKILAYLRTQPSAVDQLRELSRENLFEIAKAFGKLLQRSFQPNVPLEITFAIARNKAALEASTATTADNKKTKQEQTKLFDDMVAAMDRFGAGDAARPSDDELLEYLYKLSSHGLDASVQDWKILLSEKKVNVTRDEINFAQAKGNLIHAAKQTKQDLIQRTAEHVAVIFTQIFTDQTSTASTKTNLIQLMQSLSATIADPFKKEKGKTCLEKTRELAYQLPGTPSTRRKVIGAVGALCGVVVLTTCVALILSAVVASSGAGAIGVPFLIPPLLWIISAIKLTAASAVLVSSAAAGGGVAAAVGSTLSLYHGTRKRGICKEANDFTNQVKEMHEQRDGARSWLCC